MAKEEEYFNPLDPLGPEFGKINQPIADTKGYTAFEGSRVMLPQPNMPVGNQIAYSNLPKLENLNAPNNQIYSNVVRTNVNNPSIPQKAFDINEYNDSLKGYLDNMFQSNQDLNDYARIYSYDASARNLNTFYKRYSAYGQEKFDEVGFSPLRDNDSNFNSRTTRWDDFNRMMSNSFVPLFTQGFTSGFKSFGKILRGDFTSSDREDAEVYEEAAAIGQSTKGGIGGFMNNAAMNFSYTAGIITEAIAEEALGAILAAPTGGSSLFTTTVNNARKLPSLLKGVKTGYQGVTQTLNLTKEISGARKVYNAIKESQFLRGTLNQLNPLNNTMGALKQIRQADNFTNLGKLYKTAGGLYRDARNINMALSEARLEGGMVQNKIYDELYREAYIANGNKVPSDKELAEISKQAEQGGYETLLENVGIIYATNAITFNNITGPKGGLRNFIKSTTDDIYEIASREGSKNFGKIGKVVYNRTAKAFELEKNNLKNWARGWLKNPIHKSVGKTVSYFKANFSEGIQENLQETIAQANEKYFMDSYNSPTLKSMLYSRAAMRGINKGKLDYFSDAWAQQNPFTAQGFETFASGFVMGTMAGPLNSAVPFLSRTYNRIFNKEEFARWKEAQTTVAQNLVNELNNTNLQTFLSNHTQNLGVQERVAATKQRGTKKEALDAETEAYISQVGLLKRTGTFGIFSEKLKDLHNLTDDEFAEAVGVEKDQVDKYRARVDSSVQRLNKIKDLYERVERKNPNPINISEVKEDDPEYQEKVILYHAWETANRNIVFFNETYDNILERRAQITEKYNKNKKLKSISNRKRNLLFNPIRPFNETREAYNGVGVPTGDMLEEINLLEKELALEKETTKNPGKIQMLQEQIDLTRDYAEQFRALDIFKRREEYVGLIKEKLKAETGTEYTDEQVLKFMEDEFGAVNDTQKRDELLKNLRNSYTNYLKANAKQNGEEIFSEDIDETWELMKDYYDLDIEKTKISKYVDVLNDPMAFLEAVRRNNDWLKKVTAKKIDYYEKIIREEMDNIRANALLNSLANKGLYINTEDMLNYFADGVPPTEIYDDINKKIYPIGSKEYAQIYQDYFKKYEELKEDLNPNKSEIIDEAYQQQINELERQKQEKINALPKEDVETQINKLEGKISLKSLSQEIQNDQYVELKVYQEKDSTNDRDEIETVTVYKDKVGQLRLENEEGDILDSEDATQKYSSARIYSIDKVSDPVEVEKITNFYNEKIEEVKEAYVASKENMELEIPYEDVTPESNLDTPDLAEFKEELYSNYQKEYVNKLSPSEKNALLEDEDLNKKTFEEWYSKPENKKYFDEYNNANRPVLSKQETTMNIRGVEVNTNTKTLEQLIEYRDDINNQITSNNEEINRLNPETEKEQIKQYEEKNKELSLNVKNLNNIIGARQFANFPEEIKSAVRSIQKIFKAQSKVEKGVELTEDDEVTALKKGQKAYRINGKFHRRTTQAIQDVIDETYKYAGQENLDAIFKQTIAKKGLNPASIKEFVDMLRSLPDTGEAALPGTNDIFFNKLEEELSALPNMTAEQIELERQKDEILTNANKEKNLAKQEALFNQAEEIQNKIDGITPATTTPVSDAKADIERRRQEELTSLLPQDKISKGSLDFSAAFNIGISEFYQQMFDMVKEGKDTIAGVKEKNAPLLQKLYNEGKLKDKKDVWLALNPKAGKINAKYDAELAALEQQNQTTATTSKSLKEKKADIERRRQEELSTFDPMKDSIFARSISKESSLRSGYALTPGKRLKDELEAAEKATIQRGEELGAEINAKYNAELAALEQPTTQVSTEDNFDTATKKNTTKNIIDTFFAENSYEDGRTAGNFFDLAKDYLETGKKPEFDEKIITREAYDSLIEYLDTIKKRVDSGELYIVGRDLIVYDSDIVHSDGRKDRIAGEIDLILVDKDGIYVVDIKSGETNKFLNFNNLSTTSKKFTKRNEYTLQTAAYATMLERMIDRKVAGIAMLPIQRESNKKTNQVIEAGKPLAGQFFNELEYKVDEDGKIVLNKKIDPKTQKPFNEKQFTITGNKYKFDFLVPLYRESVQEEMDKLFPKKLGELEPGSKRAIANRINNIRQRLSEITDELSDTNVKNLAIIKVLIDNAVKQNISIPKDIIEQYESKNKNLKQYTSKEKIKSVIDKYKKNLNSSESNLKKQADELRKIKSNVSFDNIDKSIFNEESDFIKEQLESDSNFKYYFDQHNSFYKNAVDRSPTDNQIIAVKTMKESGLLTDTDISDDDIKYLSMAEASELIHEGVKRIQYLKTSGVEKSKEFREYQKNIFALMTATKINSNDVSLVQLFEDAEKLSKTGRTNQAIDLLDIKLNNLNSEYNKEFTSDVRKNRILKEILDIEQFKEALIDTYEMPIDIIEQVEAAETIEEIEDDFDTSIKVGDIVYSRKKNNNTAYTVKEKTKDSYILSPPRGKAITVKIDNFADNYITKVEMDSGNITPPTVEVTDTEKERLNESQVTVNDFLKNQDSKTEAYKKGINSTPEENRKNLLNKTKDCP